MHVVTHSGGALSELEGEEHIGARLRAIRQTKALSGREVAERAGVTAAYLSRLENGKISPTVASLTRVMQALGESVAALFDDTTNVDTPIVRRADRHLVRSHGVEDYRVTPRWADRLEILETVVAPGNGSGNEPYAHPGDQECVIVLDGTLRIWLAERDYTLELGDSITFACRTPHRWFNPSDTPARAFWVITPATY